MPVHQRSLFLDIDVYLETYKLNEVFNEIGYGKRRLPENRVSQSDLFSGKNKIKPQLPAKYSVWLKSISSLNAGSVKILRKYRFCKLQPKNS